MGVWHLSGLGINPGAVTVPLTYLYLLLKMASEGNREAQNFFATSGERGQELKGAPEALIIFTSKDVIEGSKYSDIIDNWFKTKKKKSAVETIKTYLVNLLRNMEDKDFRRFYNNKWLKYLFLIQVDHRNFEDCFFKIAMTVKALRDKEIWVNMVGGTNQINAALLSASGFTTMATRYYYLFQTDIQLLHPDLQKPNVKGFQLPVPPPAWQELPLFTIDMSRLYEDLKKLFAHREKVHIKEVKNILEKLHLPDQFLAKLRSGLITTDKDIATKGYMLDRWDKMWAKIRDEITGEMNMSIWKKWGKELGILKEIESF